MSSESPPSAAAPTDSSATAMDVDASAADSAGAARPSRAAAAAPYSVDLLSLLKSAQLSNGLRHGDYERYRQYCARRIRRLRVALHHTAGKRNATPRPLPSAAQPAGNPLFLTLALTEAERCWAYAQQLAGERTDDTPRRRFHQLKRMRRAVHHSQALLDLCTHCADTRTRLQAEGYHAELSGAEAMERQHFERAARHFVHAQTVYRALSTAAGGGGDIAHISQERADAQNDQIRLSKYFQQQRKHAQSQGGAGARAGQHEDDDEDDDGEDGDKAGSSGGRRDAAAEEAALASYIAALDSDRANRAGSRVDAVQWLGEQLPVSSDRLAALLTRARSAEAEVSTGGGDAKHTAALAALYVEAGAVVKEELLEAKLEAHKANLNKLASYCHTQSATQQQHEHTQTRTHTRSGDGSLYSFHCSLTGSTGSLPPSFPSSLCLCVLACAGVCVVLCRATAGWWTLRCPLPPPLCSMHTQPQQRQTSGGCHAP